MYDFKRLLYVCNCTLAVVYDGMWGKDGERVQKGPFNHEKHQSDNDTPHDQKKVTYFKTSGEMLAAFVTPKLLGIPNSCCTGTSLIPKDMFDSLVENIVDKS